MVLFINIKSYPNWAACSTWQWPLKLADLSAIDGNSCLQVFAITGKCIKLKFSMKICLDGHNWSASSHE